jgi:hypothetical protein
LIILAGQACAQPQSRQSETARLPDQVLGEWSPVSQNYRQYGTLTIAADRLTWATCVNETYRVLRSEHSAWLIELVRAPACPFPGRSTNPWWLEMEGDELLLSRCDDIREIEKPRIERSCSYGSLRRHGD